MEYTVENIIDCWIADGYPAVSKEWEEISGQSVVTLKNRLRLALNRRGVYTITQARQMIADGVAPAWLRGIDDCDDADTLTEEELENKAYRFMEIAKEIAGELFEDDPVITHWEYDLTSDKPVPIMLAGCMHMFGQWTSHDIIQQKFTELFEMLDSRLILLGDDIDGYLPSWFDRSATMAQPLPVRLQIKMFEIWFRSVFKRTLAGCNGQHGGLWFNKALGINPIKKIYQKYNVPFFDGQGYLKIRVGEQEYNIAIAHEFPGTSMYNKTHAHKRALWQRFPNADLIAQADRHQMSIVKEHTYGQEVIAGNRVSPVIWLVQVGTAKTGPDRYTIQWWERGESGWPWVVLYPHEHRIEVTDRFDIVRKLIE